MNNPLRNDGPWADPRVTAYVLGELDAAETAAFEQRMQDSPELAVAVEEARAITGQLENWFAAEPPLSFDTDRRESILDAAEQAPHRQETPLLSPLAPSPGTADRGGTQNLRWLALAASLLLALGALGYQLIAHKAERREVVLAQRELKRDASPEPAPQATADARLAPADPANEQLGRRAASELRRNNEPRGVPEQSGESAVLRFEEQVAERVTTLDSRSKLRQRTADAPSASPAPLAREQATPQPDRSTRPLRRSLLAGDAMELRDAGKSTAAGELRAAAEPGVRLRRSEADDAAADDAAAVDEALAAPRRAAANLGVASNLQKDKADASRLGEVPQTGPASTPQRPERDMPERDATAQGDTAEIALDMAYGVDAYAMESSGGAGGYGGVGDSGGLGGMGGGIGGTGRPASGTRGRPSGQQATGRATGLEPRQAASAQAVELLSTLPAMQPLYERQRLDQGSGPGMAGDRFDPIRENAFQRVTEHPLSTFSIDVDTAAYAKVRQFLMQSGQLPRPDVVRIEELVNYFDYNYAGPPAEGPHPLAADIEIAACPWNSEHRLARVAIQAKRVGTADRPPCNLVFLIDTSGSMNRPNRLPLVQQGLEMLLTRLSENDRVAVVVYAGSAGLVLDSTPASEVAKIRRALTRLQAGGSTNGGDGIRLAYQTARDHFIPDGINRVILCTDGDFNVGTTSQDELVRLVEQQANGGIDLSVLGFGMGNHNDAMLEQISGRGNGNYAFIDNAAEARRVLVAQATSTLFTVARDVKIQVEFNPTQVAAYRLIGYENRLLAKEDFNDDTKDAGEVGAGHSVTALYELIPQNGDTSLLAPAVDELKYQRPASTTAAADSDELMTLALRYKPVAQTTGAVSDEDQTAEATGGDGESVLLEFTASDSQQEFSQASESYRLAALVAAFGLQLRQSEHRGLWTLADVLSQATALGEQPDPARAEWIELVRRAAELQVSETGR